MKIKAKRHINETTKNFQKKKRYGHRFLSVLSFKDHKDIITTVVQAAKRNLQNAIEIAAILDH